MTDKTKSAMSTELRRLIEAVKKYRSKNTVKNNVELDVAIIQAESLLNKLDNE